MTRNGLIGVLVVMSCLAGAAQVPVVVDVSSVKESLNQQTGGGVQISPSGVRIPGADLMMTVPWIFNIEVSFTDTQIDWSRVRPSVLRKRYDIDIKGTGDPKALLGTVFAHRFGMRTHMETRVMRLSALTVKTPGRLGPRLKPSTVNCRELQAAGAFKEPGSRLAHAQCGVGARAGSIADLITFEAPRYATRPVVDRTGLMGNYEWQLSFKGNAPTPEERDVQLRDALEDQLGLTFREITGPYDVLVIDALHEPTPN